VSVLVRVALGLAVLLVVSGLGLLVAAQQRPSVAEGLKPVSSSATAAQSFDAKVDALNKAVDESIKTGKTQAIEIAFTEEELTSKAAQATTTDAAAGVRTQDTQIHLAGNQIIATSTVTVAGINVNVGVVAEPAVVNGQTQLVVKEIQTGALPLPDAVKQQINSQIGGAIDPAKLGLRIDVSQLQIVDGRLVIRGTTRP
jgi:uncharacterized protein YpmS